MPGIGLALGRISGILIFPPARLLLLTFFANRETGMMSFVVSFLFFFFFTVLCSLWDLSSQPETEPGSWQ